LRLPNAFPCIWKQSEISHGLT